MAPIIDTRSTVIANDMTEEEISRLPKWRSFQSIALSSASVNFCDIEGGFQVNGASGAENGFTVDGITTNSLINGQSRQNTVFEYLQEVQVKTTGISAEYGGALGGVISAGYSFGRHGLWPFDNYVAYDDTRSFTPTATGVNAANDTIDVGPNHLLQNGDKVVVKSRMPRNDPADEPLPARQLGWVARLLLRVGDDAEVVEPPDLRDDVRRLARDTLARYGHEA